jgi:hypothetical protein
MSEQVKEVTAGVERVGMADASAAGEQVGTPWDL